MTNDEILAELHRLEVRAAREDKVMATLLLGMVAGLVVGIAALYLLATHCVALGMCTP